MQPVANVKRPSKTEQRVNWGMVMKFRRPTIVPSKKTHPSSIARAKICGSIVVEATSTPQMSTTHPAKAYAAQGASSPLAPFTINRRDPLAKDVEIDILYCGVCHSDLHQVRNEWSNT